MKVILYGQGAVFSQIEKDIFNKFDIVAVCDKRYLENIGKKIYNDVPIISPQQLNGMEYDLLVICSRKYYESIKTDLIGNYYIDESKIVSYRILYKSCFVFETNTLNFYKSKLKRYTQINTTDDSLLSNVIKASKEKAELCSSNRALLLLWGDETDSIKKLDYLSTDILWMIPYGYVGSKAIIESIKTLKDNYHVCEYSFFEGIIVECVPKETKTIMDSKIYVVSHKPYNIIHTELYQPLLVGAAVLSDHNEKNIDSFNPVLNECTALYWIWKNTTSEIVGLNHYRRLFCNDDCINYDNILNNKRLSEIICVNDIILQEPTFLKCSTYENISLAVGEHLAYEGFEILKRLFCTKQPDYYDDLITVMSGNVLYACNMFITHRHTMNEYCEWLFSFIIEAAELLDVSGCSANQKRTIGYFAEVMLSVWVFHNELKVYSLPHILL